MAYNSSTVGELLLVCDGEQCRVVVQCHWVCLPSTAVEVFEDLSEELQKCRRQFQAKHSQVL